MISEELGLNEHLEKHDITPVETDLGEYILQIRNEPPSHIIAPAVHLTKDQIEGPTFDTVIAAQIGNGSRFRSIEVASSGDPRDSYSRTAPTVTNPAEISPLALYQRIFGAEFQDPNAADFKPNPSFMARRSILSSIKDERDNFEATLGAADKNHARARKRKSRLSRAPTGQMSTTFPE